jgi:hypothetical protein
MIEERNTDVWNDEFKTVSTGKLIPMTNNNVANNKMIQHGKTPLPTFYGGLTNTVYYRGFDLNIQLNFAGGHYLLNSIYEACDQMSSENNTVRDMVGNSWEKPGDIAKYPQVAGEAYLYDNNGDPSSVRTQFTSTAQTTRWLEKADFIRLRNIQLGYELPRSLLETLHLSSVRFYLGATNLFTITGFQGLDPETNEQLPLPRTINFGLSINL